MSDLNREISSLKVEIAHARAQTAKTEAQFEELATVFRNFGSRFEQLERRGRAARISTQILLALTVAIGTFLVTSGEIKIANQELAQAQTEIANEREQIMQREVELSASNEARRRKQIDQEKARTVAATVLEHLDKDAENKILELLPKLQLEHLDPLARRLVSDRIQEFRARVSEETYKWGRELLARSRRADAVEALGKSIKIWPDGPRANTARVLQAHALRESKRYEEAADVFADLMAHSEESDVDEEALYWQAYCRARAGQNEQARTLFDEVVKAGGKHASSARAQLDALTPTTTASSD